MNLQSTSLSMLLLFTIFFTNAAIATDPERSASSNFVKQCGIKTMTNPYYDYKVAFHPEKRTATGVIAIKASFECVINKRYSRPYCRDNYRLFRDRCLKQKKTFF